MAEASAYKYRAFISYSHADTSWAKWLHRAVEGFQIDQDLIGRETSTGTIPKSLRPVFRDRDDFTAGHTLTDQTLAALDASHALIVICSPSAAKSEYVADEIRLFKLRRPNRSVIPLIVDGKPGDANLECFPTALKFMLDEDGHMTGEPIEVLATDAREEGDGKSLALAKVVASLIGVSSDEVFRRAERERRTAQRRRRRMQAVFCGLTLLLAAGVVGWLNQNYLWTQWRWFTSIRPYISNQVRPHVLTAEAEQALKPGDTFRECANICPEMVVMPRRFFVMGSPPQVTETRSNEVPQHIITFSKPFAVSKFEVTFDDWDACVAYGDCDSDVGDSGFGRGRRPVIDVSWHDAQDYVAWLSNVTGRHYRLLSEPEWEYAARAGTYTSYSWGNDVGEGRANCAACGSEWDFKKTAPVGSFEPNPFNLYDMHGNVWEWVEDCMHADYRGAPRDGSPWTADGDCNRRIIRGGGWNGNPTNMRSATRAWNGASIRTSNLGLRIARDLKQ